MKSSVKTGCGVHCATAVECSSKEQQCHEGAPGPCQISSGHLAAIAACHRLEFPVLFAAVAEVMQKIASEFKFVEVRRSYREKTDSEAEGLRV